MKYLISVLIYVLGYSLGFSQSITSSKKVVNDSVYISIANGFLSPIEIELKPLDSTKSYIKAKLLSTIKTQDSVADILIIPIEKIADTSEIKISDYASIRATYGAPELTNHDDDYEYALPFPKGKTYKIIQSFGGRFSHNKPHSKYAIDFSLQVGDTITAARDGIVVFTKEDSKEFGGRSYMNKGNKIIIMHNDGTYANYVHLDYDGAIVKVGDKVKRGQAIAISGMTGFTTTPHLHFVVIRDRGIAIPVYFEGYRKKKLKQGKRYKRK